MLFTKHKKKGYNPAPSNSGRTTTDLPHAQVVKLVDTLASGASGLRAVEVQVFSWAPYIAMLSEIAIILCFIFISLGQLSRLFYTALNNSILPYPQCKKLPLKYLEEFPVNYNNMDKTKAIN